VRPILFLFMLAVLPVMAQSNTTPPKLGTPPPSPRDSNTNNSPAQNALDQLAQSNHDLLELLKKQQQILEDIQYDRRLQSRQIASLEERLEETLLQNSQLQNKVANLQVAAANSKIAPPTDSVIPTANATPAPTNTAAAVEPPPPPPPSTYLPPPEMQGPPGTKSWHRLFTFSGDEGKNSDLFQIEGRTWRVLWHNSDKPGKAYLNTSALFINAFPKDDTIPQKVCSKLGTGGDSAELNGPGKYYLKIEASGGHWELAVEDFR
jgi:hypothetical protein